jgi:hypothetical protein
LILGAQKNGAKPPIMKATNSLNTALLALTLTAGMAATVLGDNINPQDFGTTIDNPFFPLVPNTTYVYVGTTEGSVARDEFAVTRRTKVILGKTRKTRGPTVGKKIAQLICQLLARSNLRRA